MLVLISLGVPVAVGAECKQLAVQIMELSDPALQRKLTAYKKTMAAEVLKANAELQAELEA